MPRKLLENPADTMCHLFCGWRQWSSKNRLMELGSSTLESDILTAECLFDDERIAKLPSATELQLSLQQLFYSRAVYTVPPFVLDAGWNSRSVGLLGGRARTK
jgi:hypothetical protein